MKIKPGIFHKGGVLHDPLLLADDKHKGWHFGFTEASDPPSLKGGWGIEGREDIYENTTLIMPYNLWVFK